MQRFLRRGLPLEPICLILLASCLWPEMELLVPSLPAMKDAFRVTDADIQQLLTANFVGFLCGVLFTGGLCDSIGRKKTILGGMLFYLLASFAAVFADSFESLMLLRFCQGVAVTAPIVGGATMLMDVTQGPSQLAWLSMSTTALTVTMAGAPIVGAWINDAFGYQGNLWAIFLMGLVGGLPMMFVRESLTKDKQKPFVLKDLWHGYRNAASHPVFVILCVAICLLSAAYWVYTGVSALYMVDYLGLDSSLFGQYQGPIVGAYSAVSLFMPRIRGFFGNRLCLAGGCLAMGLTSVSMLVLAALGIESAWITTVLMMGFVAGMVPANSLLFPVAVNQLPIELQGSGQSLIQGVRLLFASVGTGTLGLIYTGPFLPVAWVLFVAFACGWFCIWRARKSIEAAGVLAVATGGH